MQNMYRSAEAAYASFDFTGLGYITFDAFMSHKLISSRIPFSESDIKSFLYDQNIFNHNK